MVGVTPAGLYLLERLKLESDAQVVGAFDPNPKRSMLAAGLGIPIWQSLDELRFDAIDSLLLMDCHSEQLVSTALNCGKHIVVDRPWLLTSDQLRSLSQQATAANVVATTTGLKRDSSEFRNAVIARQTGRIGPLNSLRLSACEQAIAVDGRVTGVLREYGFDKLAQLLQLADSTPQRVFATRYCDPGEKQEHGFLAVIEFAGGCTALIEFETKTRFSLRTGWMLEGSCGSYRDGRLYTVTADGEIVDEPLLHPATPENVDLGKLLSAWNGEPAALPGLNDAARVLQLIEGIEHSADLRQAIEIEL